MPAMMSYGKEVGLTELLQRRYVLYVSCRPLWASSRNVGTVSVAALSVLETAAFASPAQTDAELAQNGHLTCT